MIDTHAHLNFQPLLEKIGEVVEKSKEAGLTGIVVASSNLEDSKISVALAKKNPGFLYSSVGIHPQKTDPQNFDSVHSQLIQLDKLVQANRDVIVAIGETGLDFSPAPPGEKDRDKKEQEKLFLGQIELASEYNLPLIIHARETVDELIEMLERFPNSYTRVHGIGYSPRGVFHCYSGGKKRIQKILNLPEKWFFGFDGNLTYEEGLQNIIKLIPEDRIVIETDSPFLAPVPHRGQTNTPAYLPLIQHKINEIFDEDLTSVIDANSRRLFKI